MEADDTVASMGLLGEHGKTIDRLYSAHADRMPAFAGFRSALAEEDRSHAAIVRELGRRVAAAAAKPLPRARQQRSERSAT